MSQTASFFDCLQVRNAHASTKLNFNVVAMDILLCTAPRWPFLSGARIQFCMLTSTKFELVIHAVDEQLLVEYEYATIFQKGSEEAGG